jgi:hypothetical protein
MATTVKELVKVDELSKFGFKVGQEYVNYSKQLSESDKAKVVPGVSFEAEMYVADSGKRYLNKVLTTVATNKPIETKPLPVGLKVERKEVKSIVSEVMSKQDWADKDVRISRQGCIQAAVRAVATFSTQDELFNNAVQLANQMLEFVNGK